MSESLGPDIGAKLSQLESLLAGRRLHGYSTEEIPTDLDERLLEFLVSLEREPVDRRATLGARLSPKVGWALRDFAVRMATRAVRSGNPQFILLGLRALAIQTNPEDPRDMIVAVAPLFQACELTGASAQSLFEDAANFTVSEIGEVIRAFPHRPAERQRLEDFGFHAEGSEATFRFVDDAPSVNDPDVRNTLGNLLDRD
jgi:hypothetical protein